MSLNEDIGGQTDSYNFEITLWCFAIRHDNSGSGKVCQEELTLKMCQSRGLLWRHKSLDSISWHDTSHVWLHMCDSTRNDKCKEICQPESYRFAKTEQEVIESTRNITKTLAF